MRYAEKVGAAGGHAAAHVWQGIPHVFPSSFGVLDAAEQAMTIMADSISTKLQ